MIRSIPFSKTIYLILLIVIAVSIIIYYFRPSFISHPKKTITIHSNNMNNDLIKSLLDREISCLEFIEKAGVQKKFKQWCDEHGVVEDEQSAEFYVDMTVDFELLDPIIVYDIY